MAATPATPQTTERPPLYWRYEISGALAQAIAIYLTAPEQMTVRGVALIRAYLRQWVDSPVWDANPSHNEFSRAQLAELRHRARDLADVRQIDAWLDDALIQGIDPL